MLRLAPVLAVIVTCLGCAGVIQTPTPAPGQQRQAVIAVVAPTSVPVAATIEARVFGPTPGFETGRASAKYVSAVTIAAGPPQKWTASNVILVGVQGPYWDTYSGQFWAWDQQYGRTVTLVFPSGTPPRDTASCFRVFGLVRPPTAAPGGLGYQVAIEVYEMETIGKIPADPIEFKRVCAAGVDGPIAQLQ